MAVRLDPWKNIVGVHWGNVGGVWTTKWATSLNPGTTSIFKAGKFNAFTSGADPQPGGGNFSGTLWPGAAIDEMYYQETQDLEHGGPVIPQFVIIYHGTVAPSSGSLDLAYTTFNLLLAVHGSGSLRWNDPNAQFAPAPDTIYDVLYIP